MPQPAVCPDLTQYQRLAVGKLADADEEALLKHLESCEVCAQKLNTLAEPDTLVGLIRQAETLDDRAPEGTVARLVERLSKLRPDEAPAGDKHTVQWGAGQRANPRAPGETLAGDKHALPPRESAPGAGVAFNCPACGKRLKVKGELAGKKIKCPHCKETVRVPAGAGGASLEDARTLAPVKPVARSAATASYHAVETPAKELYDFLAPPQALDEIGRLGPYRVLAVLGAGGMGVVFRAEDPQLNRLVALKAMLPSMAGAESGRQRFLREARAAAAIKHDHIVSVYQVGEDRGVPFLAMEFLEGEPLDKRLTREGKLSVAEVLRFGREIALGLAAAHKRGLIHRDIKPANLWLDVETGRIKVLDFGLARAANEASPLTQSGAIVGTPEYMAPEQVQGKDLDERCDLFSLGCVLYQMSTGQMPFKGTDMISTLMAVATERPRAPRALEPNIPAALSKLILRLLAKEPGKRPESAQAVAEALQELLERTKEESGTAGAKTARPRTSWFGKKRPPVPWLIGMAGGLVSAVLAGIVIFWPTPRGVVKIESDDPNVEIVFDKTGPTIKGADKEPIKLRAGEHGVLIKRGEFEFEADKFVLKKGQTITLKVELLPGKIQVSADGQVIGAKDLQAVAPSPGGPLPKTFTNNIGMEFVLVPKGKSWLGGGKGTPGDKEVVIAHDFYLGKYEVTQEEWEKVLGQTPSHFSRSGGGKEVVKNITNVELKRLPMENVSWDDAQLFLEGLNKRDKEAGWVYGLPKEAEWEYACRGGPLSDKLESAYDFYFDKPTNQLLSEQANFEARHGWRTCKVGSYKPNRLGLYDMHGNVWEWCDDTEKAAQGALLRVLRGGSWAAFPWQLCRATGRIARPPSTRYYDLGLRVARVPVGKESTLPPTKPEDVTKEQGFVSHFNGKDLAGWVVDSGDKSAWQVKDGQLVVRGTEMNDSRADAHLLTERDYSDFRLRFQFQRSRETAYSGIVLRAVPKETMKASNPDFGDFPFHLTVWLGKSPKDAKLEGTGALWWSPNSSAAAPLLPDRLAEVKPPGEWNDMEVEMRGQALRIAVNGREVLNVKLNQIPQPKNPAPGLKRYAGRIGFLKRTGEVRFRNIEIKELTPTK